MSELEARLRAIAAHLPEPDAAVSEAARTVMHRALDEAPWRAPGRRRLSWRRTRPFLLATGVLLVIAAGALAARGWSIRDLPPFGQGDQAAFVLPTTDVLPGGYPRTRPPRYADLARRPSIVFPAGIGYTQALEAYAAARGKGEVLPQGAVLSDPLPFGKVVQVRDDGRVALDPAAPFGWSPVSGLVIALAGRYRGEPVAIPRCELLIGASDPDSPACDAPGRRTYVREGVDGRWLPSPNEEGLDNPLVSASTALAVIDHPTTPAVKLAPMTVPTPGGAVRTVPLQGRLALEDDGQRLIVATYPGGGLCFIDESPQGAGRTCGPRSSFLSRGAMFSGARFSSGPQHLSGLVGDGITEVTTDDGRRVRVTNNAFLISDSDGVQRLTFSGPVGRFSLPVSQVAAEPRRFTPNRSRERELVGVDLRDGGHASVRVAPNRGGGRCWWVYVNGHVRSTACSRPGDQPLSYDQVTGSFIRRIDRVPDLFQGWFAREVGSVEIGYADGDTVRLTPTEGFVLFEVPAGHLAPERRATTITTYDREGVALARSNVPFRG
ncbi:MAG: hypothetical protein AB7O78_03150 [Thermoleophilia bacterium]